MAHSKFTSKCTMLQLILNTLGLASASVGAQDPGVLPLIYAQQVGEGGGGALA